jgi:hypothetical protein
MVTMLLPQFKCQQQWTKESKICLFLKFRAVVRGHLFCQPEMPFPARGKFLSARPRFASVSPDELSM